MEPPFENQFIDFWQGRYESSQMPWDLAGPSPYFQYLLTQDKTPLPPGKMAVPGCGRGHDAALFARHGFDVTGFDYAPGAVAAASQLYNSLDNLRFEQADLFYLSERFNSTFDYVLEHTCFCAINPKRRPDYVRAMRRLLKPGGMLIGIFWDLDNPEGPPFGSTEAQIRQYFAGSFEIRSAEPLPAQYRRREEGVEFFVVMRAV